MDRVTEKFAELKRQGHKALIAYIPAGWPTYGKCEKICAAMGRAGVDIIEIGIPFSDPIADGPTIQAAAHEALERGANLDKTLRLTNRLNLKFGGSIPLLLMSYANPVFNSGLRRFMCKAETSGVAGLIIPDLIPEESSDWRKEADKCGLAFVHLIAPTTAVARRPLVVEASSGFIYVVSVTGVTGARRKVQSDTIKLLRDLRRLTDKPLAIGFGISSSEQVRVLKPYVDGVIVGSALLDAIRSAGSSAAAKTSAAVKFIKNMGL